MSDRHARFQYDEGTPVVLVRGGDVAQLEALGIRSLPNPQDFLKELAVKGSPEVVKPAKLPPSHD